MFELCPIRNFWYYLLPKSDIYVKSIINGEKKFFSFLFLPISYRKFDLNINKTVKTKGGSRRRTKKGKQE